MRELLPRTREIVQRMRELFLRTRFLSRRTREIVQHMREFVPRTRATRKSRTWAMVKVRRVGVSIANMGAHHRSV
jgi:hypothetical protein